LGILDILNKIGGNIYVPTAVVNELEIGIVNGIDLPVVTEIAWFNVIHPQGEKDVRLLSDMGPGETEVMMIALESDEIIAILDDGLARQRAALLEINFTGTLGIILDAKHLGLIKHVKPLLMQLNTLGFHLSSATYRMILNKANEV
jgi:predicted nucleic acid-binding protein